MKIAMVQVASPVTESVPDRRERVGQMVADAAGADLVVLPELWAPGYFSFDSYPELAEPIDGDTVSAAREWARSLNCFLHLGTFLERTPDGGIHNTAVLIEPSGSVIHTYQKFTYSAINLVKRNCSSPEPKSTSSTRHWERLGRRPATTYGSRNYGGFLSTQAPRSW